VSVRVVGEDHQRQRAARRREDGWAGYGGDDRRRRKGDVGSSEKPGNQNGQQEQANSGPLKTRHGRSPPCSTISPRTRRRRRLRSRGVSPERRSRAGSEQVDRWSEQEARDAGSALRTASGIGIARARLKRKSTLPALPPAAGRVRER